MWKLDLLKYMHVCVCVCVSSDWKNKILLVSLSEGATRDGTDKENVR
jgi:hypothetical protein